MNNVLLLDNNYTPINIISIKKAIKLVVKEKAEILISDTKQLHKQFNIPKVLRLLKNISMLYKVQIPWSKYNVLVRDRMQCQYCGKKLKKNSATIDHVIPTSKGGKNSWENTVTACKPCNSWKDNKLLHETNLVLLKQPKTPTLLDFFSIKFKEYDMTEVWETLKAV